MRYAYRFSLKSVLLLENGEHLKLKGNTLLSVRLYMPTTGGNSSIETIYKLPIGVEKEELLKSNEVYSLEQIDFTKKGLFTSKILGHVIVIGTIAITKSPRKILPILKNILKGVITGTANVIGGPGGAIIAGAISSAADTLLSDKKMEDKVTILCTGNGFINNGMPTGEVHINLSAPKELRRVVGQRKVVTDEGERIDDIVKIIPEGAPLGHVVLFVERIRDDDGSEEPMIA